MTLDPKALEAAWNCYHGSTLDRRAALEASIAAYLSTVTPAEIGGLVERLRQCADDPMWSDHAEVPKQWLSEAAAALEAQAAELVAKEEARAEQWRLHREVEADRDTALASLAAERAALAEARKALEPFALVAEMDIGSDEADADLFRPMSAHNRAPLLTVGDLRDAARSVAKEAGNV